MFAVIIAVLLVFLAVVRNKWRNAAEKKEEIFRLLAMASEEEAELEKRETADGFIGAPASPLVTQPQQRYYCALCYSPAATRCSQCKAVRYCSGKCQINHWRRGHKYDCQPATLSSAGKEHRHVMEAAPNNRAEVLSVDETNWHLYPKHEDSSFKSSGGYSAPLFPSRGEENEAFLDASATDNNDSAPPNGTSQEKYKRDDSHFSRATSDSDEADAQRQTELNDGRSGSKLERSDINRKSHSKSKTTGEVRLEEFAPDSAEMKSLPAFVSSTTSLSETPIFQPSGDNGGVMKSSYSRVSSKRQVPNSELRNARWSRSLNFSASSQHWKNEAPIISGRESKFMSYKSAGKDQTSSGKSDRVHSFASEAEPKSNNKGLKTSLRKFVENFRTSKLPNSFSLDAGKESVIIHGEQVAMLPQMFLQLYSSNNMELHPFGLLNCGNSCYANAVLQCLAFTRPLTSYFLQGLHSRTCRKKDWCLICEFEHLIQKGRETNYPLSPLGIISHVKRIGNHLIPGRQEDAHDFLRNMVEKMQSIWLEESGSSGSLAEDSTLFGLSFGGYVRSKIKCLKCSGRSVQCDRVMDIAVEISGDIDTLNEALGQFTISETLGGDDKYKCSRCKSYERAKKKLTVVEAPNILTLVLKRFQSGNSEKLNKFIRFHEILDLAPYMSSLSDEFPIYDLYATVVHSNTMNDSYSGHYISYVKNIRGEWFRMDDSRVSRVDVETVLSAEAYMLFYARRSVRIPSFLMNSSVYSDYKMRMSSSEAISADISAKNKSSRSKPSGLDSKLLHQPSGKRPHFLFGENDEWRPLRSPVPDSSSDNSSIFSASDAGSYSTDSAKESSVEDISGYIFGSNLYHR